MLNDLVEKYQEEAKKAEEKAIAFTNLERQAKEKKEECIRNAEKYASQEKAYSRARSRVSYPDWKVLIIDALAEEISRKTGNKVKVLGPAGIGSRCFIHMFLGEGTDIFANEFMELVIQPDFEENGDLIFVYETGEVEERFAKGSIGYFNGMNNVTKLLPNDIDEIIALFKHCQPIG